MPPEDHCKCLAHFPDGRMSPGRIDGKRKQIALARRSCRRQRAERVIDCPVVPGST